jgi:hypothetical protein
MQTDNLFESVVLKHSFAKEPAYKSFKFHMYFLGLS